MHLSTFFGRTRKKENVDSLKMKIQRFQSLLSGNNHVLELFADAEESLGGDFLFDMQYLRTLAGDLETSVKQVVDDLNVITGNQYKDLNTSFKAIRQNVENELLCKAALPEAPFIIPLPDIRMSMSDVTGEKMGRLGELKRWMGDLIPDGFVVTGNACLTFFEQSGVRPKILRVSDMLDKGAMSVLQAEARITSLILNADVPGSVARRLKKAVAGLVKTYGKSMLIAVRSSALGEDGHLSFAGLHDTLLGMHPDQAVQSYKRVVASLFSSRAINYRLVHGQSIESAVMAVGFIPMIPAVASGVLYTMNPLEPETNQCMITATPGLGKMVVEGQGHLDRFDLSRTGNHEVVTRHIARKTNRYSISGNTVDLIPVDDRDRDEPSVSEAFLKRLVAIGLEIEKRMKSAQDIEWSLNAQGEPVILQARPLKIQGDISSFAPRLREAIKHHDILMSGRGMVACRGIAHGRVVVVPDGEPVSQIPADSVLVARNSSPALAELVSSASAVITDFGSPTSHLATITREMKVPSIMDTGEATHLLKDGMEVTVDAEENIIYQGKIDALIQYEVMKNPALDDIAEFHILSRMLKHVSPLHMKNPQHAKFQAKYCKTYHDIIRFAHEKSVLYFFDGHYLVSSKNSPYCRTLSLDIPIDLRVIDIGGGLRPVHPGKEQPVCHMDDLGCMALESLVQGLTSPGAWSTDAAGMDFESFMSSMTRYSVVTESIFRGPRPNLAIVSENYLNLNLHLGYHFNQVDCYVSDTRNDNYIYFRFAGGVTDYARRERRAQMISIILKKHDFLVETKQDFLVARLKKFDRNVMLERLIMIGYLIGFSRQMDVRMRDDSMIEKGVEAFMKRQDIIANPTTTEVTVDKNIDVLVLDDETIVCERLKDFLEKQGMAVETFSNSDDAISRLNEKTFDVVVTDMKMPGSTGMDVLRVSKDTQPATQVIIISAFSVMGKLREAEAMGSYHYLTKPFQLSDLHTLIKKAAKQAKKGRDRGNNQKTH